MQILNYNKNARNNNILNLQFFKTFSYLHTGSLEESSTLFLSHFPKFVVHNTENWRIEACEYIVIKTDNSQDSQMDRHSHIYI